MESRYSRSEQRLENDSSELLTTGGGAMICEFDTEFVELLLENCCERAMLAVLGIDDISESVAENCEVDTPLGRS